MYDKSTKKDNYLFKFIKSLLIGSLFGAIICTVFLVVCTFLLVFMKSIPEVMVQSFAVASAAMGAFVAGFVAVRLLRSKGLICGAATGLLLFLMVTLIAFIISRDKFTFLTFIRFISMTIAGALGGLFGLNKKRKHK